MDFKVLWPAGASESIKVKMLARVSHPVQLAARPPQPISLLTSMEVEEGSVLGISSDRASKRNGASDGI